MCHDAPIENDELLIVLVVAACLAIGKCNVGWMIFAAAWLWLMRDKRLGLMLRGRSGC